MNSHHLKTLLVAICAVLTLSGQAQTVHWLVRPQFLSITHFGNKLYKCNAYNYQALIDGRGKVLTTADSITYVTNGYALALAQFNGRYLLKGILNKDGVFTQFRGEYYATEKSFFSEDKCIIVNKKGKYGYMDPSGVIIIPCNLTAAEPFSGGAARVVKKKGLFQKSTEGGQSYINARGEDCASPSGAAHIPVLANNQPFEPTYNKAYTIYDSEGKKGYMVNGEFMVRPQFTEAYPFADGLAIAKSGDKYGVLKYLQGAVSCKISEKDGKLDASAIIPAEFDDKEARIVCNNETGETISLAMQGMRSMRSLSADFPANNKSSVYKLIVDGLVLWEGTVYGSDDHPKPDKPKVSGGISVSCPGTVKANKKGICAFDVKVTNRTSSTQTITVSLSTGESTSVKLNAGRSGKASFSVKVSKDTRVTISAKCAGGSSSCATTLKPSFVL